MQSRPWSYSDILFVSAVALGAPAALAVTSAAQAQDADISSSSKTRLGAQIERHTAGRVHVDGVAKTPIAGLLEVTSGTDIFYVEPGGRYAIVDGHLMDLQSKQDLTAFKLDRLNRIDFQALPFDLAIKTVHGSGRRALAIFEDPTCPVCRALHKFIAQLPDVTIYTFAYPVVTPEAMPVARAAWCSGDRAQAWDAAMRGASAQTPSSACDTGAIDRTLELGDKLHVMGTPTVFLSDGRRLVGATPPDQFVQALDELVPAK